MLEVNQWETAISGDADNGHHGHLQHAQMLVDAISDDMSKYIWSEVMKWHVQLEVKVNDETLSTCWKQRIIRWL